MPVFSVSFTTTVSSTINVKAENVVEAKENAEQQFYDNAPDVCGHCANARGNPDQLGMEISGEWEMSDEVYETDGKEFSTDD